MGEDNIELQFKMDDVGKTGDSRTHTKTGKNGHREGGKQSSDNGNRWEAVLSPRTTYHCIHCGSSYPSWEQLAMNVG
jgi:hypothetical protein